MKYLGWKIVGLVLLFLSSGFYYRYRNRPDAIALPAIVESQQNEERTEAFTLADALEIAERGLGNLNRTVTSYTARLVKQERVDGHLGEPSELFVKIQNPGRDDSGQPLRPMRVYLKFLTPTSTTGREVIWGEDLRDKKLVAHEGGLLGVVRLSLDPHGPIAMLGNRYPIDRIGLSNLTEELLTRGRKVEDPTLLKVAKMEPHDVDGCPCVLVRIENVSRAAQLGFSKIDIAVDLERMIPLHLSTYDWGPQAEDAPLLQESYTYYDVRLNPGLSDMDFDPDNPEYKFP